MEITNRMWSEHIYSILVAKFMNPYSKQCRKSKVLAQSSKYLATVI
jgi:hypothetical protein